MPTLSAYPRGLLPPLECIPVDHRQIPFKFPPDILLILPKARQTLMKGLELFFSWKNKFF
jgi:hypothetical protein